MILIDSRIGSGELLHLFPKGSAKLDTLDFGDFAFTGNGPEGMPLNIGIERKQVREIASTMSDGRLVGHQIPGLLATYQIVYLVVEGRWRGNPKSGILEGGYGGTWGEVVNGTTRFMAEAVRKYLATLEMMAGVRLRFTEDKRGTAQEVLALHSWWTGKEWSEHQAHIAMQYPPIDTVMFRKPSLFHYWVACLPGIGWKRGKAVEEHFFPRGRTFEEAAMSILMADVKEWCQVEGIGKTTARKVVETIKWRRG